jgi:hypothetical protein
MQETSCRMRQSRSNRTHPFWENEILILLLSHLTRDYARTAITRRYPSNQKRHTFQTLHQTRLKESHVFKSPPRETKQCLDFRDGLEDRTARESPRRLDGPAFQSSSDLG